MREILFRGKLAYNGVWVYGGFYKEPVYYIKDGKTYIITSSLSFADNTNQVIPKTVGQSTGRTDKNGKRVFEGDILCADTGRRWVNGICTDYTQYVVVVYNSQKARFEILGKLGESHKALDQVIDKCSATVVGNIHDNPELLEAR